MDSVQAFCPHGKRNFKNIETVDKRRDAQRGEDGKFTVAPNGTPVKSAEHTAEIVGNSARKVNRARTVLADPKE
jgi:hypothetical protein